MTGTNPQRRAFLSTLTGLAGLALVQLFPASRPASAESAKPEGYVIAPNGGEHLVHFRDHGNIYINLSARTGSEHLAIGTQQVTIGVGIPTHRHLEMDEAFYVLEGAGMVILNDVPHRFERGSSIFIPKNSWHSFANPEHELLLLWTVTPAGLDGFFRETCSPPGAPAKQLTREQIKQIAKKYGTEFR